MSYLDHSTQIISSVIFGLALIHTFTTSVFNKWASRFPQGSIQENTLHFLGEVEVVFGIWAGVFIVVFGAMRGFGMSTEFLESLSFTEPAFVFAIMVISSTKPVLNAATSGLEAAAKIIPLPGAVPMFCALMVIGPISGSFITEPAAMTLTALLVKERLFDRNRCSNLFKYATLGLLFVNISIGGVLTPFAAPPVVMVASKWNWDIKHMMTNFGIQSVTAVIINTALVTALFWKDLAKMKTDVKKSRSMKDRTPLWLLAIHAAFLAGVVASAHHMTVFSGLFLLFLGVTEITREYQEPLRLRESLLVAYFLAGLVVLGKGQEWWLRPLLEGASETPLFWGTAALTAITDNAALTYLASQVEQLTPAAKHAIVAGAVTGGGLTVIANAPNPAGYSILKDCYGDSGIEPLKLFAAAIVPTLVAAVCFMFY